MEELAKSDFIYEDKSMKTNQNVESVKNSLQTKNTAVTNDSFTDYEEENLLLKNYCFSTAKRFDFPNGRIPDVVIIGAARCGLAAMIKVSL